ncbi:MAG: hypothetical protein QW382_02695 [Nitrososphaerota archaeon]
MENYGKDMKKLLVFILFWLIILTIFNSCLCYDDSLIKSVRDTYSRLVDAEEKGADIREVTVKLNRALQLIREARDNPENRGILLSEAYALIEDVNVNIPLLIREGESKMFWRNVAICSAGVLTAVTGVLVYRFGPRIFWETWLRVRSRWIVEVKKSRKDRSDRHDR